MKKFSWQTPEYVYTKKTSDWYWTVGIISGAIVFTSMIFGNYLFGIVLGLGVFTLTIFTLRKPNTINVEISETGIRVDKMLYPYNSLDSFGLDEEHHHGSRLFLKSKKVVMPLITIPLAQQSTDDIRTFLTEHIKEETFEQGLMHTVLERLGF